ncbi:MAG: aminopeptidase P family protein, partial [Deltaproteobacteria bacterium]|nr:aminopeptidase P family protein [Deltaproteobacteria bacterium]
VKDPLEQSLIRGAARMGDRLLEEIPRLLEESETETDLAARAEFFYRRLGHPGVTRVRGFNIQATTGHIAAGASSALPSASPGPTGGGGYGPYLSQGAAPVRISPREPILVDYLASVEGYYADQARIFSIGELPARFSEAHRVMIEIQETLALKGLPGARAGDLYGMALEIAKKAGLGEYFMGHPQPVPFVGHGIGLELDEWPVIAKNSQHILEEGMVIALEPKVVFPGQGVLGIEDTFLVSERGMEKLNRFPEEIQVLPGPPT